MAESQETKQEPKYTITVAPMTGYEPDLEPSFLIDGLLNLNEVSIWYGTSSCGKTAAVIRTAAAITKGQDFLGAEVRKGMVLYAAAEAPKSVQARAHLILQDDEARENFVVLLGRPNLSDPEYVRTFIETGKELMATSALPAVLAVFDTGARSFGGADENNNEQMTRVIDHANEIARALNIHVIIIHHTGKEGDRGARGASAIRDACDTEIRCTYSDDFGRLEVTKQRNDAKRGPMRFELRAGVLGHDTRGKEITAVIADFLPEDGIPEDTGKPMTPLMTAILTILHLRSGQSLLTQEIVDALPPRVHCVSDASKQQRKVSDACDALVAMGAVQKLKVGNVNSWRLR